MMGDNRAGQPVKMEASNNVAAGSKDQTAKQARGSPGRRPFLRGIWPHSSRRRTTSRSSSFTATSMDEDDTSSWGPSASSPVELLHTQKTIVRDNFPTEIEVVYGDDSSQPEDDKCIRALDCEPTSNHLLLRAVGAVSFDSATTSLKTPRNFSKKHARDQKADSVAFSHFEQALECVSSHVWDEALQHVEEGLERLQEHSPLYWKLLTVQAEVLGRRGDYAESLKVYQCVLKHARKDRASPDIVSSLYYACGRLAVYLKDYVLALEYYTQELVYTRAVSGDSLAVARIYHELARVSKSGLGDWEQALSYYEQALRTEVKVWKRAKEAVDSSDSTSDFAVDEKQRQDDLLEAAAQIQETKKCMGRINFALGRIDEAMRLSSGRFSLMD